MAKSRRTSSAPATRWFNYSLDDLFDEEELKELTKEARWRVIATFHHATEPNPRYREGRNKPRRGTDNYIIGVSPKLSDLARTVHKRQRKPLVRESQLPSSVLAAHGTYWATIIRQEAEFDLLMHTLDAMRVRPPKTPRAFVLKSNNELYFDEGLGVWQIVQSSIDDYLDFLREQQAVSREERAARMKQDDRSRHGRPHKQSRRRHVPEGISTGGQVAVA